MGVFSRAIIVLGITLLSVNIAYAYPIEVVFSDLDGCDSDKRKVTHELGNHKGINDLGTHGHFGAFGNFPDDEAIDSNATSATVNECDIHPNDNANPDYKVSIKNLTKFDWINLYFVADADIHFDNRDGDIAVGDAMLIDNLGINTPLIIGAGSDDGDLVFESGEVWEFFVLDWSGVAAPRFFTSLGVGVFSEDPLGIGNASNASIVATRKVPEPGSIALLSLGLVVVLCFTPLNRRRVNTI